MRNYMSTKIYNGYKTRILNIYELNEFYKDVRRISNNEMERNIIIISKIKSTPSKYPRKAGKPSKEPIM